MSDISTTIAQVRFDEVIGSGRFPDQRSRLTVCFATIPQGKAKEIYRTFARDRIVSGFESLWMSENYDGIPARFAVDVTSGQMLFANFRDSTQKPTELPTGNFDITFHRSNMDEFSSGNPKLESERVYNPGGGPGVFRVYFDPMGEMVGLDFIKSLIPSSHVDSLSLDETGQITKPESLHGFLRENAEHAISQAKQMVGTPFLAPKLDDTVVVSLLKAVKEYGIRETRYDNRICDLGPAASEIRGPLDPRTFEAVEDSIFVRRSYTYGQNSWLSFVVPAGMLIGNFPGLAAAGVLNRAELANESPHERSKDRETVAKATKHLVR